MTAVVESSVIFFYTAEVIIVKKECKFSDNKSVETYVTDLHAFSRYTWYRVFWTFQELFVVMKLVCIPEQR